jgi:hypothetical protein
MRYFAPRGVCVLIVMKRPAAVLYPAQARRRSGVEDPKATGETITTAPPKVTNGLRVAPAR